METEKEKLEEQVRKKITASTLTVRELADKTGVSTAHLTHIKKNHPQKRPSLEILLKLARYFDIPYRLEYTPASKKRSGNKKSG